MFTVMMVDDEEDLGLLYKMSFKRDLERGNFRMLFFTSPKEAIKELELLKPEERDQLMILSDINMPEINGLEFLNIVKKRWPHVPMGMVTAYGDGKHRSIAMNAGADYFFDKPIDKEAILKKIHEFI